MTYVPIVKTLNSTSIQISGNLEISSSLIISGNSILGNSATIATGDNVYFNGTAFLSSTLNTTNYISASGDLIVSGNSLLNNITASSILISSGAIFDSLNICDLVHTSTLTFNTSDAQLSGNVLVITTENNNLYYIDSKLTGKQATQSNCYSIKGLFRNIDGFITIITQNKNDILTENAGCDAVYGISSSAVVINITGSTGKTINWKALSEIRKLKLI